MDSLVLSLGHNSSAIAIRDGHIIGGYETERITGIKSDSSYPYGPIAKLLAIDGFKPTKAYVGHWFLDAKMPQESNKYINYEHLLQHCPGIEVESLDQEFTHHDSHLESAKVFAGDFEPSYHAFVMDGFGSYGECISIYKVVNGCQTLINRWFGFENSLGMLYQYATAYMGMKQHNHEYKILAYEVGAYEYDQAVEIKHKAIEHARKRVSNLFLYKMDSQFDPLISLNALPRIQLEISGLLDSICEDFEIDKTDEKMFRSLISLYVQTVVETVVLLLVDVYQPQHILLSGGLFYNVKINSLVSQKVPGKTCVMPLAGDQGAGLGVYQRYNGDLVWPEHLFWGHRDLDFKTDIPGIYVVDTMDDAMPIIVERLNSVGFVNLVRGSMEFGPRALCNTTTIAVPTEGVCDLINYVNDRTSEMPMAPFVNQEFMDKFFVDGDKIHKSLEYMIMARNYKPEYTTGQFLGAQHFYPESGIFTGRPQLTNDPHLQTLLYSFGGLLINTSFNYHGHPIVMDETQIKVNHFKQFDRDNSVVTVVVRGK